MRRLEKINESLPALCLGILIYGMLAELIGVWFVSDRFGYSLGLLLGVAAAEGMAFHMAWSLNKTYELDEGAATKQMQKYSTLRYGVLIVFFGILMLTKVANPLSAFLGVLGLKVSAYLAPFTHKIFRR